MKLTYEESGVDKSAGYESVNLIKKHVKKTLSDLVLNNLGSFAGAIELPSGYEKPVLLSGTDGVGTKLAIAIEMDKHDTIGIDAVAMCVNDILCHAAMPLFFLDYIACGKNYPKKIEQIVKGISKGCIDGRLSLIGGETAEMPGMYNENEYDLAGFAVGIVDKDKFIDGSKIKEGDILIGLSSSGVHSNGYSLIRKLFFEVEKLSIDTYIEDFSKTLGEELLTPTKIYVNSVLNLLEKVDIKGMSHITGGGFIENVPRMIPDGLCARLDTKVIDKKPIFEYIAHLGKIERKEMYSTFNMGIGFVIAVNKNDVDKAIDMLKEENPVILGNIVKGEEKVELCL